MTGINHKQAQRYLRAAADGLLRENQRALLDAHLRECDSCRAAADELNALEARLKKSFQAKWDANDGPSKDVMSIIHTRSRRIIMTNRIKTTLKTAGGIAALLLLIVFLNSLLGRFRSSAAPAAATQTNETTQSTQAEGLIAFVSKQDNGNREIFTMQADGSELTNLTNNPATDESPAWSPDGTRIAFTSDRSGDMDIYVMNADGSNLSRLTDDRGYEDHFSWSPDGTKIVYSSSETSFLGDSNIMIMNADGSNKTPLTPQPGKYSFLSWSPDGQHIVFQSSDNGEGIATHLFVANINGGGAVIDGLFFEGDTGRQHQQVYWETPNQFVTINSNFEQTPWGKWNITRFFTDGDNNRYNDSNPILITSEMPIFAIFENTYVTLQEDSLVWLAYQGAPFPYSPWKMDSACKTKVIFDLQKAPDGRHAFVSVNCEGGSTSLYLVNSDGSEIKQLGATMDNATPLPFPAWSPDGKQLLLALSDQRKVEYYRVDVEELLDDPSAKPIQLTTTGSTYNYGAVWQPQPFRFGVPVESKEQALIAAQSGLKAAYKYAEPLTVITAEQLSYGEYAKRINQPLNSPSDLKVWFIVYFNNEWQSALPALSTYINDQGQVVPFPTEMSPVSQFRGCVYMAVNAGDGSVIEVGGPLPKGIMPECDN